MNIKLQSEQLVRQCNFRLADAWKKASSNTGYSDWAMEWTTEESWFDSWQGQDIFLFSVASKLALGPTKPLV